MMYSNPLKQKIRSRPLVCLGLWIGMSATLSFANQTRAFAEDLVIPEPSTAAPAPAPAAIEPSVAPVEPAPAVIAPEPTAVEPAPAAVEPEPIVTEPAPVAPAVSEVAPAPAQTQSDPYIDTQDYSVGATQPYTPPDNIVVNERSSGCQATLGAGQIASSLCGSPPAQQLYTLPSSPTASETPAWANRWAATELNAPQSETVSAQTIRNTLQYSAIPPQNLAVKPLTGANPLKWMMENGERMIFPLSIPVEITSVFGWRIHPITKQWRFHSGTDLGAPMGTPVLAAYSGRVSLAEFMGGYGLSILLDHNQGKEETQYAHLSEVFVKPGQWVQQGTVIGLVGSTGNSTGPHLHFEAKQATSEGQFVAVDPGLELQTTLATLAKVLQTARLTAQQPVPKVGTQSQSQTQPSDS
jgi:hypothetical protein